jgi:nucleotide-binding universal stress UspA family protein
MLPFQKILCPTDFSEPAGVALRAAAELVQHFSAELLLVHVIPPVPAAYPYPDPPVASSFDIPLYQQELAIRAEKGLEDLVSREVSREVRVRTRVVDGDPAGQVLQMAEQEHADLIVIATHGMTGWRHLVFGSVAEKVVRLAPCPVLTIRAPREER